MEVRSAGWEPGEHSLGRRFLLLLWVTYRNFANVCTLALDPFTHFIKHLLCTRESPRGHSYCEVKRQHTHPWKLGGTANHGPAPAVTQLLLKCVWSARAQGQQAGLPMPMTFSRSVSGQGQGSDLRQVGKKNNPEPTPEVPSKACSPVRVFCERLTDRRLTGSPPSDHTMVLSGSGPVCFTHSPRRGSAVIQEGDISSGPRLLVMPPGSWCPAGRQLHSPGPRAEAGHLSVYTADLQSWCGTPLPKQFCQILQLVSHTYQDSMRT